MKRLLRSILGLFGWRPRLSEEEAKRRWEQRQGEVGAFDYDEEGFSYPFETGTSVVRWTEVDRIVGYKLDLFTTDEICIELQVGDRAIRFSESTPGWFQFLGRLKSVFPSIPDGWDWDVAKPSFATNYMVLYEREGGDLPGMYNFSGWVRAASVAQVGKAFEQGGWRVWKNGRVEVAARNGWSEMSMMKDRKGVSLTGRVALRSGRAEDIDRVLYGIGSPYQYEFYDEERKVIRERHWP